MWLKVERKEFKKFIANFDYQILPDINNKSNNLIIRRLKDNKSKKIIAMIHNWKKYYVYKK